MTPRALGPSALLCRNMLTTALAIPARCGGTLFDRSGSRGRHQKAARWEECVSSDLLAGFVNTGPHDIGTYELGSGRSDRRTRGPGAAYLVVRCSHGQ